MLDKENAECYLKFLDVPVSFLLYGRLFEIATLSGVGRPERLFCHNGMGGTLIPSISSWGCF